MSEAGSDSELRLTRREAIRRIGGGGATLFGSGLIAGGLAQHAVAHAATAGSSDGVDPHAEERYSEGVLSGQLPTGAAAGMYGGDFDPPDAASEGDLDARTLAPARRSGRLELEMEVVEVGLSISRSHRIEAWTYDGFVPGPVIRATEGDLIRIRFRNPTGHPHNLHFHGRHSPTQDGWEPVPPGGEVVYEIDAGPAGVHPYHCHTMPIDRHIARGLYGTLIVDPKGGRPPARELVLVLGGFDPDDAGYNAVYAWNGVAGFFAKYPIKVEAGEPIRLYLLNAVEFDPVASFHLHAQTFDVWPSGMGERPAWHGDVIGLGQMERAMLEFTLPERGRYMFHPHQHSMAARGAMGWFAAV